MSQSPARILVTRSEPGAAQTAARLAAAGYRPICEPLFVIRAIDVAIPDFDALAFTSLNGVRRFAELSARRDAPVLCVGARTADAARQAGFSDVKSADGDVSALRDLVLARLPAGARLLHAGNQDSRGDLAGQLTAKDIAASFVALFRAEPVMSPGRELSRHLAGQKSFEAALIHSPRAGILLADLIRQSAGAAPVDIAAISAAAAAPLSGLARRIGTASTPHEEALLASLASILSD